MSGAPARGTSPRRPRRQNHELTTIDDGAEKSRSKVNKVENRPKVNPIFLWALQHEQRIIEVRCEDYDKRNRIKLTKTAHGWRSIPRTASNVYATSNGRACDSPSSSSSSSPRWSPATISSSSSHEMATGGRDAESNYPNDSLVRGTLFTLRNNKVEKEANKEEFDKRRKNDDNSDEDSREHIAEEMSDKPRKKRRRERRDENNKSSNNKSNNGLLVSSPRSWERLMNGTRFLNSGPNSVKNSRVREMSPSSTIDRANYSCIDLQPRVVLEQLQLSVASENARKTSKQNIDNPKESRDDSNEITAVLDSTGSPVLVADPPSAHLPSCLYSTKANKISITSFFESKKDKTDDDKNGESVVRLTGKSANSQIKRERTSNNNLGKIHRRENEMVDSSSEILEALRSTPGLSVSVTTMRRSGNSEVTCSQDSNCDVSRTRMLANHTIRSTNTRHERTRVAASQLRHLLRSSSIAIPDPLLVPRDCLPALAASPAIEIPKLLATRPELRLPEALTRPDLLKDPNLLVISLAHLQQVLDDAPGSDYPSSHPDRVGEEDELMIQEDEDEEEEEDQDVPEQSLNLDLDYARNKNKRIPPKLISCKPIGSLMAGPIDLSSRGIRRTILSPAGLVPGGLRHHHKDPPPPLLRVRSGLLKQESQVTSSEISAVCHQQQDDSHLWHPLFGSQKRQMQQQQQQQQHQQQQPQQTTHRTPWHRTTLAS